MITQIKTIGTSKGIILSPEFLKFHKLEVGTSEYDKFMMGDL